MGWGGGAFVCFLTPPALPGVPVVQIPVRQTYFLSSLTFMRVTSRSAITNTFHLPLFPQVLVGATGCLKHINKRGMPVAEGHAAESFWQLFF